MSCFGNCSNTLRPGNPDPTKHVLFTQGMVLGVDDLNQEFAYLSHRDQWLARDLIGYGTVNGLSVAIESDASGPRIAVAPGVALSPKGQLIRVKPRQCAALNDWLKKAGVKEQIPTGSSNLSIYLVLCYRDCPTDEIPILGEPCRTEAETKAPSRLTDDFRLEFRFQAPDQREEEAIRQFVDWLHRIEVADFAGTPADLEAFTSELEDLIPNSLPAQSSPPDSILDFLLGSPPPGMRIPRGEICDYLRAAFRLWVTRIRPLVQLNWSYGTRCDCHCPEGSETQNEECLLLAELNLPLILSGPDWVIDSTREIIKDESRRPWLMHLRVLQEWLLCGSCCDHGSGPGAVTLSGDVTGDPSNNSLQNIRTFPIDLTGLANNQVLAFDNTTTPNRWRPVSFPTFVDPIPAHVANLTAHSAHQVAGDVTGAIGNTVVQRIQTFPINLAGISNNQVLAFDNTVTPNQWRPINLPTIVDPIPPHVANVTAHAAHQIAGEVTGTIGNTRVTSLLGVPLQTAAPVPATQNGFVLKYRISEWRLEQDVVGGTTAPNRATTGIAVFRSVNPGDRRTIGPIKHTLDAPHVSIRLGIEVRGERTYCEDTVEALVREADMTAPFVMVRFDNGNRDEFFIVLEQPRQGGAQDEIRVRWYAVPITEHLGESREPDEIIRIRDAIRTRPNGISITEAATATGLSRDAAGTLLRELRDRGELRELRGRFLPPQ